MSTSDLEIRSPDLATKTAAVVQEFAHKQKRSNKQWLEAAIARIEGTAGEQDAAEFREQLAVGLKFSSWATLQADLDVKQPRDLLRTPTSFGQRDTGTQPPLSQEERDHFFSELFSRVHEIYHLETPRKVPAPNLPSEVEHLPADLIALFSVTDGIRDTDLRNSGVSGIDGIHALSIDQRAPLPPYRQGGGPRFAWSGSGWVVRTGITLGRGQPGHLNFIQYNYCVRYDEPDKWRPGQSLIKDMQPHERQWKWRIFYKEPVRFQHSFKYPMVFDDIAAWLQWYQEWWQRESQEYPAYMAERREALKYEYPSDSDEDVSEEGSLDGSTDEEERAGYEN